MKRIISIALAVVMALTVLPLNVFAVTVIDNGTCGDNLTWELTDGGTLTISGTGDMYDYDWLETPWYYCDEIGKVVITDGVTSIGDSAFYYCSSLTSITIPDSVTSIGRSAFYSCSKLTSITIPDSVTSIGDYTFYSCKSLTSITIPDSVTSIGNYAFRYCSSLTSIAIPDSVTSIGDYAFYDCSSLTSITIPDSVTSIGDWAFYNCSSLTSITIPDSVTNIGNYAFYGCAILTSISIPDGVTSIGDYAFRYCSSLTSITIPDSVTSIGNYAFCNCPSLTSITIPDSVTSIGSSAFSGCSSLTSVNITDIAAWCNISFGNTYSSNPMYYAKNLYLNNELVTKLVIPDGVTSIGDYAFCGCSSLASITIPESVTGIGNGAFYNCSSLTSITIPDSVTSIGDEAFWSCSSLRSITIPESVTSIGYSAFSYCSKLKSVTIGNGVTSIGERAFYDCSSLTSISIPDGVTSIGDSAFEYCSSLTSVKIGDGVTSIGDSAFEYCSSLTSVKIGDSVRSIGDEAFCGCSSLKSITFLNYDTEIYESSTTIDKSATIYGYAGSTAQAYAEKYGRTFVALDAETELASGNCGAEGDNVKWALASDGTLTISGSGKMADYTTVSSLPWYDYSTDISSVIIEYGVTRVGGGSFSGCSSITSVTISNSVTVIGAYAFNNCSSLSGVTIPDSITDIKNNAFSGCSSLKSITIPASATSLGSCAFYNCSSLTSITFISLTTEIFDERHTISDTATIYGYAGSTAQAYAEKYDRKFVELYTADVLDIPSGKFGVYVVDSSSLPVEGANVIATSRGITNSGITGENGLALVDTVFNDEVQLKVTKEGYQSVTVDRVVKSGDLAVVTVNVDDGKPHVFAVNATLGNKKYDLMHEKKYFKSNSEGIDAADDLSNVKNMVITVEASASDQIDCYQLIQGGKVVAQSNISTFYIPVYTGTPDFPDRYMNDYRIDTFSAGKDVYLRIVDINGEVSGETKLGLVISKPFTYQDNSEGKLTFGKKIKLSVPSDIPIIGGDEIELGWEGLPFDFEVFEDGKVKFAVNIPVKNDESGFIDGTEMLDWDDIEDVYMNALSGKPAKGTLPQKFGAGVVKLDANIIGYGEGYVDNHGNIVINVGLVVSVYQDASYTWTYFIGYVPVYIAVGEELGFTGSGEFSIVNTNGNWEFTGAVGEINPKFSFNVDGGVGANGVLSVGASGKGTLSWLHRFSDNYENVSLTAELKVIATAFLFKYEKHLWERTWTLYDSNSARTTLTSEPLYSGLYAEEAYNTISRDYLYSPAPLSFDEDVVKSNVFPHTIPELVKIGDLSYLFWLDDITERSDNDRTALVYAVSSDNCKTWSEPAQVIPEEIDGAAAFDYDICVDGTDIHIVLSRSNQSFGNAELDLNQMAASSEIYYVKMSTLDNSTTIPLQITDNIYADTMPAIVSHSGEIMVAFTENRLENGLFGTGNTYNVCTSIVGTEIITTSEINGFVTELSAGVVDEKITIAYVVDTDCDFSTDDDTELWIHLAQQSIKLSNEHSRVYSPTFAKIGINDAILWYSNGNIYYSTDINETAESVFTNTIPATLSRKFFVINGINGQTKIIWNSIDPDSETNGIQIYATEYSDNRWTDIYKALSIDSDITSSLSGYCEENSDYITYLNVNSASDVLTASLNVNTVLPSPDIAIVDVEYDYENVHLGEMLPLTITVKNCGNTSISDFSIIINGNAIYQITDASLSIGETKVFDVAGFAIPEFLASAQSFNITVTTFDDVQFENNSFDFVVGYTDLSMEISRKLINNEEWISVSISNLSEIGSSAYLTVTADSKEGLVLYNGKLTSITSNASQLVMINLDVLSSIKETDVFYISVTSDNTEISLSDNTELLYLVLDNTADYTSGDVNGDDTVDNNDAIYLLYYTIFGEEGGYTVNQDCDFNDDGIVDNNDAIYLLYHTIFGGEYYPLS